MTQEATLGAHLFSPAALAALARTYKTPLWVYDAATIERQIAALRAFDVVRYAQKANSNLHVLRLVRRCGAWVDAVSLGEIERALAAGFVPRSPEGHREIVLTSDVIDAATLSRCEREGIAVNCGSIDMIEALARVRFEHPVWLRINPGFGHGHSHKTNTGGENSKHGIWHTDLPRACDMLLSSGLALWGLHMHIGSGVDYAHLQRVSAAMTEAARIVIGKGLRIKAISAGGGLSIPYCNHEVAVDVQHYHSLWNTARNRLVSLLGQPITLEIEPGRFLVAQAGVLVAQVLATKRMGNKFYVLVDAGFNDLVRPCMYGSHHEISIVRPDGTFATGALHDTVVAGPLCESGDVFTQDAHGKLLERPLPIVEVGDWLVLHDTGAYGASMSSNYNTRPLAAEVLIEGGHPRLIRRRQTVQELLALEAT
ncbi:diaminopimelate decarboxylase [Candidatus Symbiobacter mobilis CR]|uniref:Diaminopimelate decarboxylase n=1 Tax=Candidatus Symbiobacter mobilis CR TaxID=946483 RepID=U5N459_9BURK|nr:diaminopimelate decarboxylase [Candidatus Symbiobacter mobilis CR]